MRIMKPILPLFFIVALLVSIIGGRFAAIAADSKDDKLTEIDGVDSGIHSQELQSTTSSSSTAPKKAPKGRNYLKVHDGSDN